MAPATTNVSYAILLKPVQDQMLKDWSLTLGIALDNFITHLEEHGSTNFSEAAVLVSNSATFYCKRVDAAYKIMQELVLEVCQLKSNNDSDHPTRRKKKTKSLESTDLQLLDFVASENSIDANIDKIIFQSPPTQIVLNTSTKALRKQGTSVTVYQRNGLVLGCKEEFKCFGIISSDGTVNEDFVDDKSKVIQCLNESAMEWDAECNDVRDFNDEAMDCPPCIEPVPSIVEPSSDPLHTMIEPSTQIPDMSTMPVSPSLPLTTREFHAAPRQKRPKKVFHWEPVPHVSSRPSKNVKINNIHKIPNFILDSEDKDVELVKIADKLKQKKKVNTDKEPIDNVQIMWIDQAVRVGLVDSILIEFDNERLRKKSLTKSNAKSVTVDEPEEIPFVDDADREDEPDHFEDLADDNVPTTVAPFSCIDNMINEDTQNGNIDDAIRTMQELKSSRKRLAVKQSEVAERVARWHETIMPVLEAAETRSQFDVHEYGTRILQKFPDDDFKTLRPFGELVIGQPKVEISRFFLSSLMLANTYSLEISKSETGDLVKDCVQYRLISKVRHHEEMNEALRVTSEDCGT